MAKLHEPTYLLPSIGNINARSMSHSPARFCYSENITRQTRGPRGCAFCFWADFRVKLMGNIWGSPGKGCKERGEWAELRFMARAAERGLAVSRPHGDSASYDVGVEHNGRSCACRSSQRPTAAKDRTPATLSGRDASPTRAAKWIFSPSTSCRLIFGISCRSK